MHLSLLTLHIKIPVCDSLKEKRGKIKTLLARLHKEFNISAAEVDMLDQWHDTVIACSIVSNNHIHNQQALQQTLRFIEITFPDLEVIDHRIEHI